jgi:hypothetical protein
VYNHHVSLAVAQAKTGDDVQRAARRRVARQAPCHETQRARVRLSLLLRPTSRSADPRQA